MTEPNVELYIDALVLDGLPAGDQDRVAAAVQHELAQLFADRGVSSTVAGAGDIAELNGAAFDIAADASPETIGAQVAQALYGRLSR